MLLLTALGKRARLSRHPERGGHVSRSGRSGSSIKLQEHRQTAALSWASIAPPKRFGKRFWITTTWLAWFSANADLSKVLDAHACRGVRATRMARHRHVLREGRACR